MSGGYAYANQFKRLRTTVNRWRNILGVAKSDVQLKLDLHWAAVACDVVPANEPNCPKALSDFAALLRRAERIRTQQCHGKHKLHALQAPEVECISKGTRPATHTS